MDEFEIDRDALVEAFLAEAEEVLGRMEQALVAFEAAPQDEEQVHALFREAHTLKGGAALLTFDGVRDLAHEIEGALEGIRRKTLTVGGGLVSLLLGSVDVLRSAIADAAAGRPGDGAAAQAFHDSLLALAAAPVVTPGLASPVASEPARATGPARLRTLRVEVAKLDRLLDVSGEIAIARGRFATLLEQREAADPEFLRLVHRDADRLYLDLQELVMQARMVPIGPVFFQHARTVRDVARSQGKEARLETVGAEVEVDTAVVEQVRDPITHMVRNAVDHGIEAPEARRAAGKDPCGRVVLRAFHDAGAMVIEIEDDGAGLDRVAIAREAVALGVIPDAARATDDELAQAIFAPGLSTSTEITEVSGRGVGMDVVRRNVEALHGAVAIRSTPGLGTTITLRVPLTLAIIQGFRVAVAGQVYIVPLDAVVECVELPPAEAVPGPVGILARRGRPLPYLRLRSLFDLPGQQPRRENVVVVRAGTAEAGLAVDELLGEHSTVIKPLGRVFKQVPGVSGSTILGDGRVALILDVPGLLRETLRRATAQA